MNPDDFERHPDWIRLQGGEGYYAYLLGVSNYIMMSIHRTTPSHCLEVRSWGTFVESRMVVVSELQARVLAALHPGDVYEWLRGAGDESC